MCMWPCHSHGTSLLLCVRAVCVCGSAACYVFIAARAACARALISADRIDFPYTTYKISPRVCECVSVHARASGLWGEAEAVWAARAYSWYTW